MAAKWPTSIATDADLYVAVNSLQTTLSTAVNAAVTSVVLASATGFPTAGAVTIDNEVIFYTNISGATLTGCTRGADGTTAASHSAGVPAGASIIAFHHNGLMAEVEAIETDIDARFGRGASSNAIAIPSGVSTTINSTAGLAITPVSNQLVLGTTRTVTVTAPTPATSSRTWTIPDITGNGTFAALEGTQTFSGSKTFSAAVLHTAGSAGSPGISFSTATDLGIYSISTTKIGFSTGGSLKWSIDSTGLLSSETANALITNNDGSAGTPAYAFGLDTDTGMYRLGSGQIGFSSNGAAAVRILSIGSTNATTYVPLTLEGSKSTQFEKQTTTSVTTAAITILNMNNDGGLVLVNGSDGTNKFFDVLVCASGASPSVVQSKTLAGSPSARTYTSSNFAQKVQMASGTYTVTAQSIEIGS